MDYKTYYASLAIVAVGSFFLRDVFPLILKLFLEEGQSDNKIKKEEKRKWADEIIAICTEGDTHGYSILPTDFRHIYYVANQVSGIKPAVTVALTEYISSWSLCAFQQKIKEPKVEDIKFCQELQTRAKAKSDYLIKEAHKMKL